VDLGIKKRSAIVCASSRGLGEACAASLAREGARVFINGRNQDALDGAALRIEKATGQRPVTVKADITIDEGRERLIAACPNADILINNNAGPTPGKLEDWDRAIWLSALESNMLAPILIRAVLPGMRKRRFGRIVNITSAMVKSPAPGMGLSTGANRPHQPGKSISHEAAADNVTINNLLPERIDTDRQRFMAERMMQEQDITLDEARRQIAESLSAKRFGLPGEFADACAFRAQHKRVSSPARTCRSMAEAIAAYSRTSDARCDHYRNGSARFATLRRAPCWCISFGNSFLRAPMLAVIPVNVAPGGPSRWAQREIRAILPFRRTARRSPRSKASGRRAADPCRKHSANTMRCSVGSARRA
jgi:3-oxoacyl-[acyl-carrier protein] reductase